MFTSGFSTSHSAMSLIIINLNSFFRAVLVLPKVLRFQYHINARWVRTNFLQQFCHMETDFYERYMVAQKNIQVMKTCCIIFVSKLRVILQMCLLTISSFL